MDKGARLLRRLQDGRILCRDFDEIADDIIVPELERLDTSLGRIVGLKPGDDVARVVAQTAILVELFGMAFAHEAAVAREQRQFFLQRRLKLLGKLLRTIG